VLLFVHHAAMDAQHARENGFDPADYIWPETVAGLLDDDWAVEVDEQRPRTTPRTWCCARVDSAESALPSPASAWQGAGVLMSFVYSRVAVLVRHWFE